MDKMKAQENIMVDEMVWNTALWSLVQPTEQKGTLIRL